LTPDMGLEYLLPAVCESRVFFLAGHEPDTERAARVVLDEFRGGKIGRITLERPSDWNREAAAEEEPSVPEEENDGTDA